MHKHSDKCGCGEHLVLPSSIVKPDELAGINISSEYELISQKKSALSARLRRLVMERYMRTDFNIGEGI
jgi:hypothetical protein